MRTSATIGPAPSATLDAVDREILALLRANARATVTDIGLAVGLSPAPVSRRIERLDSSGVITGYVALANPVSSPGSRR